MSARPEPPPLATLQSELGELLRRFESLEQHPCEAVRDTVARIVAGNERVSPHEQAEIYRDQFWLRHRDSLREDFPALAYLVGDESFEALARAYLLACPPDSYTLRDLGLRLGDFAAAYDGFDPELAGPARELACFELSFVRAFDAADVAPLTVERVTALPPDQWPGARLGIHPHLELFALEYPIFELRPSLRAGLEPDRIIARAPAFVAVWRASDKTVYHRVLAPTEHALLTALRDGLPLGDACNRAARELSEPEQEALLAALSRWFRNWGEAGWIVSLDAGP